MKIYKEIFIPERKEKRLVSRKCDLCGKKSKYADWSSDDYGVAETELSVKVVHKSGESYPEASFGKTVDIDLCPECFQEKLIPWLKEQGATINEKEWDY